MRTRITSVVLLLCMLFAAFALSSCGKKGGTATEGATTPAATEGATTPATDGVTTPVATDGATTPAATDGATTPAATEGATTPAATEGATEPATVPATEPATDPATVPATVPATDPGTDWETISKKVKGYGENMRKIKIECADFVSTEKIAKNKAYLAGPDEVEAGVTPEIEMMVYARNHAACELLGLTIEYDYWDHDKASWGKSSGQIVTLTQGNAADAPDLFVNMIYDLNKAMLTFGAFKELRTLPRSYFNFETKGWMKDYMDSMSFTGDRAYVLASDYFLDVLRSMGVLPFNMSMMDDNATKLASVIVEDGELDGEALSTYFFDLVEGGDWTWELLGKLCTAIYFDADGDDQNSIGDTLGIIADCYGGVCTSVFIYSCGQEFIEHRVIEDESNPNNGKMWAYYPTSPGMLSDVFDAVASVFNGKGALTTMGKMDQATADEPGLAYHRIKFKQGELLFAGASLLGDLEDDNYQTMEQVYSVVPLPKVNAESEYNTFVTNTCDAGAINVRITAYKASAISAYLQYCTEHSAGIREEFLEIVTKYKTTTYDQGTDRMLDLIYENIRYGGAKVIDDAVGGGNRWHDIMKNGKCLVTAADLEDDFETQVNAKQETLDGILEKWYALPKSEG